MIAFWNITDKLTATKLNEMVARMGAVLPWSWKKDDAITAQRLNEMIAAAGGGGDGNVSFLFTFQSVFNYKFNSTFTTLTNSNGSETFPIETYWSGGNAQYVIKEPPSTGFRTIGALFPQVNKVVFWKGNRSGAGEYYIECWFAFPE
jgi:hypothetical protein